MKSWTDGPAKQAVLDFVAAAVSSVPMQERVAVFDNDGTLWCEKPMPIQLDFILRRLVEMAGADPSLADQQPWKAACEQDAAWLSSVITDHYAGDDRKATTMMGGILAAFDGIGVEEFERTLTQVLKLLLPSIPRPDQRLEPSLLGAEDDQHDANLAVDASCLIHGWSSIRRKSRAQVESGRRGRTARSCPGIRRASPRGGGRRPRRPRRRP